MFLCQLHARDFSCSIVDAEIPEGEVEYVVTEHAIKLFPDSEHLYFYNSDGDFQVDIITNDICLNKLVYSS